MAYASSIVSVPLSRDMVAIIDSEDEARVLRLRWSAHKDERPNSSVWYARSNISRGVQILMHRFIVDAPASLEVDHRDGNGLNNRRSNLRLATRAQNCWNKRSFAGTSRFKGVYWRQDRNRWCARIDYNGRRYCLGNFDNECDAAIAYDSKARELFGEFARLNFPDRQMVA